MERPAPFLVQVDGAGWNIDGMVHLQSHFMGIEEDIFFDVVGTVQRGAAVDALGVVVADVTAAASIRVAETASARKQVEMLQRRQEVRAERRMQVDCALQDDVGGGLHQEADSRCHLSLVRVTNDG